MATWRRRLPASMLVMVMLGWTAQALSATATAPTPGTAQASTTPARAASAPSGPSTVPGLAQRIETPASTDAGLLRRGEAVFSGQTPMRGALVGQVTELPAPALRCINCHQPPGVAPTGARPAIGSVLDARALRTPAVRRGGPPSYYTEDALCRLLRDGIDPAQVMVAPTMPRYVMAAADCQALWAFLVQAR